MTVACLSLCLLVNTCMLMYEDKSGGYKNVEMSSLSVSLPYVIETGACHFSCQVDVKLTKLSHDLIVTQYHHTGVRSQRMDFGGGHKHSVCNCQPWTHPAEATLQKCGGSDRGLNLSSVVYLLHDIRQ